jgi:hypothetical protein
MTVEAPETPLMGDGLGSLPLRAAARAPESSIGMVGRPAKNNNAALNKPREG